MTQKQEWHLVADIKVLQAEVEQLQAGIHGYIADAKTAKNACAELIKIQGEQARMIAELTRERDVAREQVQEVLRIGAIGREARDKVVLDLDSQVRRLTWAIIVNARRRSRRALRASAIPNKCSRCGLVGSKRKGNPITCHHKDGNALNRDLNNLEWLCVRCHKAEHHIEPSGKPEAER